MTPRPLGPQSVEGVHWARDPRAGAQWEESRRAQATEAAASGRSSLAQAPEFP